MAITIAKRSIQKISIIDDQAPVRDIYELAVEDLGLESVSETGPPDEEPLPDCVKAVSQRGGCSHLRLQPQGKGGIL